MFVFLPFLLSISHIIFQSALDSNMIGYGSLIKLIQEGNIDEIAKILAFGSKEMIFLAFVGILNFYLLLNAKNISKWFGFEYDDRLVKWSENSLKRFGKWTDKKRKAGWEGFQKWKKRGR